MDRKDLFGKTAAILVADHFHVLETFYPFFRLKEGGADVCFVGANAGATFHDAGGEPVTADISAAEALSREFDLILCPGGFAPLALRANPAMLRLSRNHFAQGRVFATLCHGGSFLVSMGILEGRRATCYRSLRDDLVNAGAEYVDDAPTVDGNLVTARTPADLPSFMEAVISVMKGVRLPKADLSGKTAAVLVENRYDVHEAWYSYFRLTSKNVATVFVGPDDERTVFSRLGKYPLTPDLAVSSASDNLFDAIVVTGDWASDKMRMEVPFLDLLRVHQRAGKVVGSIAEGHSVLVSAGLLRDRKISAVPSMRADIENAGAQWVNSTLAVDGNLVTAGSACNLPEFLSRLIRTIEAN